MARVLLPRIKVQGGVAAAGDQDWSARLVSYIPLTISGIYPILDNALSAYSKTPIPGRLIPLSQVNQNLVLAGQIRNGAGFEFFGRS